MGTALIGALSLIVVAGVTGTFTFLAGRNRQVTDRALAHQEVDLLAKLDKNSDAAKQLNQVIEGRIQQWHEGLFKDTEEPKGLPALRADRAHWTRTVALVCTLIGISATILSLLVPYLHQP